MVAAEVVEKIDYSKIPLAKDLLPALKADYSLPHIYSGKVILYNPKMIDPAPTSFADLWNPKYKGKVGVIDIQYQYTMMAAALASGGTLTNFEPGKAGLLEAKKLGVRIYPTNEAMAQALKTEEVGLCIMWKARAVQWQNSGVNVQVVTPKEGVLTFVSEFLIPKNAPNKDGAYAFLNATLMPSSPRMKPISRSGGISRSRPEGRNWMGGAVCRAAEDLGSPATSGTIWQMTS